jgi:GNAT superfamily N-acetyltransferase
VITIRPAQLADVPLLLQLIRELAEYERLAHQVVAGEGELAESLFGARPAAEALIAELDGNPAGFAVYFTNFSTFLGRPGLYLEDLFVRPAVRRRGVGRALFLRLAELAAERKCGRFEWSVLDWNQPAIAFYRSLGAVPLVEWTVFRLTGDALTHAAHGDEPRKKTPEVPR